MTEHNRMPARQIIVYGDCWPVTIAVAHWSEDFCRAATVKPHTASLFCCSNYVGNRRPY